MASFNFNNPAIRSLCNRLGEDFVRHRLELEERHHPRVFSLRRKFLHVENWYSIHNLMRACFRIMGIHRRGEDNARKIRLNRNVFKLANLPRAFHHFRILHLSDLHLDMDHLTTHALIKNIREIDYDLCVLTGDYRANTYGDSDRCMDLMEQVRLHLPDPVYAVLGNHDSLTTLPRMDAMGITVLLNESRIIANDGNQIAVAGIDDAHYFGTDDVAKSREHIPENLISILLSHTPETFAQAEQAGFDVFLCGHTHGGQICLPGGLPVILEAQIPRRLGKGHWCHGNMQGYTSVGAGTSVINLRFNCPPEITLHELQPA